MNWSERYLQKKYPEHTRGRELPELPELPSVHDAKPFGSSVSGWSLESSQGKCIPPPLTQAEEASIRAWLVRIDETTPEGIADVLGSCREDAACRAYYLGRAKKYPEHTRGVALPELPELPADQNNPASVGSVSRGSLVPVQEKNDWLTDVDETDLGVMVACGACQHFKRAAYHHHLGRCTKGEPMAAAGIWDNDQRWCRLFEGAT